MRRQLGQQSLREFIMFKSSMSSVQSGSSGRHKATLLKEEAPALTPSLDKLPIRAPRQGVV